VEPYRKGKPTPKWLLLEHITLMLPKFIIFHCSLFAKFYFEKSYSKAHLVGWGDQLTLIKEELTCTILTKFCKRTKDFLEFYVEVCNIHKKRLNQNCCPKNLYEVVHENWRKKLFDFWQNNNFLTLNFWLPLVW